MFIQKTQFLPCYCFLRNSDQIVLCIYKSDLQYYEIFSIMLPKYARIFGELYEK